MEVLHPNTVTRFAELFYGRTDAWFDGDRNICIRKRLTLSRFRDHLLGVRSIGTYPVLDDCTCRWGCIDLDEEYNDYNLAYKVWRTWKFYGVPAWIERSRSKGWHVWVFTGVWVPASTMRNAGLWVAEMTFGKDNKIEVNPKNDDPKKTPSGLVNTVRLPYSGSAGEGRMRVVDPKTVRDVPLEAFVSSAMEQMASQGDLDSLSAKWRQARLKEQADSRLKASSWGSNPVEYGEGSYQEAVAILAGKTRATVGERDNQLYTIARYLHGKGIEFGEAISEITRVWEEQLDDKSSYSIDQAIEKVTRTYYE